MSGLGEPDVFERLANARRAIDDLKGRQFVGSTSMLIRHIETAAPFDRQVMMAASDYRKTVIFTFTAERQYFSLSDIDVSVCKDDPSVPAAFYFDYELNVRQAVPDRAHPLATSWVVDIYKRTSGAAVFYLKARITSSDHGILS